MAASSRAGSRADTGCGMAPIFHVATTATNQSTELGRAMVTRSPSFTPSSSSCRARASAANWSSARVMLRSPQVMAGAAGSAAA